MLDRTISVSIKMKEDLKRISFWTTIIVQIIFLFFYSYSIYKNVDFLLFLVIYIVLAVLSLLHFIYFLASNKSDNKKLVKKIKRVFRISKYLINGTMLGVNIYEMLKYGITDFNKVLLVVSGISLLVQVIIECARFFIEKYIELFQYSLKTDLKGIYWAKEKMDSVKEVKGNFFSLIDAPLEKLADKLEGKEKKVEEVQLSKKEQYVEDLASKYRKEQNEAKEQKKQEQKQKSRERALEQKEELKEHLRVIKNSIFKSKSK